MSTVVDSKTTLVALQGLRSANADMNKASERLATGLRINSASDDPAGFGKAAKLKAQIGSFEQVKKNIGEAIGSASRVSDALVTITDYLIEMRSLALASSAESDSAIRAAYKESFDQLGTAINEVAGSVKFGDSKVLLGGDSATQTIQTGIDSGNTKTLTFAAVSASALNVSSVDIATAATAASTIAVVDTSIGTVAKELSKVGGYMNSLQAALDVADSNILSKSSQYRDIMDADLAAEATNLAAARIRQDSATAVLAQANSMNRTITDYLLSGAMG